MSENKETEATHTKKLESVLGHTFADKTLLKQALSGLDHHINHKKHRSLAFLGDTLIKSTIAVYLHTKFPNLPTGLRQLIQSSLDRRSTLSQIGRKLSIENAAAEQFHIKQLFNDDVLAETIEALLGAIATEEMKKSSSIFPDKNGSFVIFLKKILLDNAAAISALVLSSNDEDRHLKVVAGSLGYTGTIQPPSKDKPRGTVILQSRTQRSSKKMEVSWNAADGAKGKREAVRSVLYEILTEALGNKD